MEIINLKTDEFNYEKRETGIALGNFDGIHIAHKEIILNTVTESKKMNLNPSVLLFDNHTKLVLESKSPSLITSKEQKLELLEELGIDTVYIIPFDKELMSLSPENFVKEILLDKLNVKLICVGFDYRFGHKASGNILTLKNFGETYGFNTKVIDPIYKDNVISSTKIRKLIRDGKIKDANNLLGRNYSIIGRVVDGNKMGHKLGFPTANLDIKDNYVIPKNGIYETKIIVDKETYMGATSIGTNPTFENNLLKIENHILNFDEDIYGEIIEVEFIRYIRDEKRFDNIEDLKYRIKKDIEEIKYRY